MDGGGQLTVVLVPACAEAADAAVLPPPAVAARPSEPAVRAAEITAPAAARLT
jgi:hypothetical protein